MTTVTLNSTEKNAVKNENATTYAGCRAGSSGTKSAAPNNFFVGQIKISSSSWYIYQGFLTYDLSVIPAGADITDAYFRVRGNSFDTDWAASGESLDFQFKAYGHPISTSDYLTGDPLTSQDATLAAADAPSGAGPFDAVSINVIARVAAAIGSSVDVVVSSHKQSTNTAPSGAESITPSSVQLVVVYSLNGSVSLGASGALTAGGSVEKQGAAGWSAAGSLTATALATHNAGASLAASATLAADATVNGVKTGQAVLSSAGALSPTGRTVRPGVAALVASSSLVAAGGLEQPGTATLAAVATLAANGNRSIDPRRLGPPPGIGGYRSVPPAGSSIRTTGRR